MFLFIPSDLVRSQSATSADNIAIKFMNNFCRGEKRKKQMKTEEKEAETRRDRKSWKRGSQRFSRKNIEKYYNFFYLSRIFWNLRQEGPSKSWHIEEKLQRRWRKMLESWRRGKRHDEASKLEKQRITHFGTSHFLVGVKKKEFDETQVKNRQMVLFRIHT